MEKKKCSSLKIFSGVRTREHKHVLHFSGVPLGAAKFSVCPHPPSRYRKIGSSPSAERRMCTADELMSASFKSRDSQMFTGVT